jgi:TadE-like protein
VHRDILIACLPCFLVLCAAMLVLRGMLAVGVAAFDWRRLTQMHSCQRGGVQSLAFVLTMPIFIMVVLLIVQVSQLMIAQMVLHYAAFAGARAASVWLPAAVDNPATEMDDYAEVENRVSDRPSTNDGDYTTFEVGSSSSSQKLWKVRAAVLQALAPLAPSRDLGARAQMTRLTDVISANQQMYATLVPASQSNSRIAVRITNKLNYADQNTRVVVEWRDGRDGSGRDSLHNTAYNVRNHTCPNPELQTHYRESEIGWQDPITVYVIHQFALLPGPGRFLAARLIRADGLPDRVSPRIQQNPNTSRTVYTTTMTAAATITCEGLKSVKPLVQPAYALPGR